MRPLVRSKTPRTKNGYQGKKKKKLAACQTKLPEIVPIASFRQLRTVWPVIWMRCFLFVFLSGSMQVHRNQNIFFFYFTHCWSRAQPRSTGLSKTHLLCQSENITAATAHVMRLSGDVKANALTCKLIKAWSLPLLIQRKVSRFSGAAM